MRITNINPKIYPDRIYVSCDVDGRALSFVIDEPGVLSLTGGGLQTRVINEIKAVAGIIQMVWKAESEPALPGVLDLGTAEIDVT